MKHAFDERNLAKAGYEATPRTAPGRVQGDQGPMDDLTKEAVKDTGVSGRSVLAPRTSSPSACSPGCSTDPPSRPSIGRRRSSPAPPRWLPPTSPHFRPGTPLARPPRQQRSHSRSSLPRCAPAPTPTSMATPHSPGADRRLQLSGTPLWHLSDHPASDILHELARHKNFGVRTFQAEDEIAGVGSAIGAAFAGSLAVTGSSALASPEKRGHLSRLHDGVALIVINVQRGGPSTGSPTKPEQSDLLFSCTGVTASLRSRCWRSPRRRTPSS